MGVPPPPRGNVQFMWGFRLGIWIGLGLKPTMSAESYINSLLHQSNLPEKTWYGSCPLIQGTTPNYLIKHFTKRESSFNMTRGDEDIEGGLRK